MIMHMGIFHDRVVEEGDNSGIIYWQTVSSIQALDLLTLSPAFVGEDAVVVSTIPSYQRLLSQSRKRSRLDICLCVLQLLEDRSMTIGEVAIYARLNFKTTRQLLDNLVGQHFLSEEEVDGRTVYHLTSVGEALLADLRSIYHRLGWTM
jgi:predicted transcriptional regulator